MNSASGKKSSKICVLYSILLTGHFINHMKCFLNVGVVINILNCNSFAAYSRYTIAFGAVDGSCIGLAVPAALAEVAKLRELFLICIAIFLSPFLG